MNVSVVTCIIRYDETVGFRRLLFAGGVLLFSGVLHNKHPLLVRLQRL